MQQIHNLSWLRVRMSAHCVVAAMVLFVCGGRALADSQLVGSPAPDFALKSLQSTNVRLSERLGEVVLINFWATWSGPSRQEMPLLEALHAKYQRAGLVVLGISLDEDRDEAAEMARTLQVTYPILFDARKDVSREYRIDAMPLTVLVDREGVVRYVSEGFKPGYEKQYTEKLRELLGE